MTMANKAKQTGVKEVTELDKAAALCDLISQGESVREAARRVDMEPTMFYRMLADTENAALMKQYLRARETRADARFEYIEELKVMLLARAIDPNSAKVLIDATFRQIGKENAKRYGDKVEVEQTGEVTHTLRFK